MELKSNVFENEGDIPKKYTCESEDISPPLSISDVPEEAKSLTLIAHDPDVPKELQEQKGAPAEWTHWVLFNISPETKEIPEGSFPEGSIQGKNGGGENKYQGPCPPKEFQPSKHRYYFKLYALSEKIDLPEGSTREDVERAIEGKVLDNATLLGFYEKS